MAVYGLTRLDLTKEANMCYFKKWANPGLFSFIIGLFKQTLNFFTTNICEIFLSSIQCQDLNPRPSECESPPITTRPGLPP